MNPGKIIIFDSSTLINLSMNGLLDLLEKLKSKFNGKFIIPYSVKYETIDRPLNIKKFELGALKVQQLLNNKTLELPESIGLSQNEIKEKSKEIINKINKIFYARNEFMHIVDEGEVACLSISLLSAEKKIDNIIAIDERTTRMIGENPTNLHKLLEHKLHMQVKMYKENVPSLPNVKFIRSSELVYVAWKKGLIELKSSNVLDALLYATRFKGAAISNEEIEEIKKIG